MAAPLGFEREAAAAAKGSQRAGGGMVATYRVEVRVLSVWAKGSRGGAYCTRTRERVPVSHGYEEGPARRGPHRRERRGEGHRVGPENKTRPVGGFGPREEKKKGEGEREMGRLG